MDSPVKFISSTFIRVLIIIDILFILFLIIFNLNPFITEIVYSNGIYIYIANIMGKFSDLVKFSITEILAILIIIFLLIRIFSAIYGMLKGQRTFKNVFLHFLKQIFILGSIIFLWFYFIWGFNYFRVPLEKKYDGIVVNKKITDIFFENTVNLFINKANKYYRLSLGRQPNFITLNKTVDAAVYKTIKEVSNNQNIRPAANTKFYFTNILENTNTLGMISPFFLEAQISKEILHSELPFIMAHEKVHLYGYADETEANYLAFLSCINSDSDYLKYSAYSQILVYFLREYRRRYTDDEYEDLVSKLNFEIMKEYQKKQIRFNKYNTAFSRFLTNVYNYYLKLNRVSDGIMSYSRVIQLILKSDFIDHIIDEENIEIIINP